MNKIVVPAAIFLAVLTGCGGAQDTPPQADPPPSETTSSAAPQESPTAEESPTPEVYSPGEFEVTTDDGAVIRMQIPSDPVTDIEAFREQVGVEPVTYMTAQIDNRSGSTGVSMYEVTLYDPDGNSYVFQDASVSFIGEWGPTYTAEGTYVLPDGTEIDVATGDALSSQSTDLYNKYLESGEADPLERNDETVMIGAFPSVPQEITGVAVRAYGGIGEQVMASPVE